MKEKVNYLVNLLNILSQKNGDLEDDKKYLTRQVKY